MRFPRAHLWLRWEHSHNRTVKILFSQSMEILHWFFSQIIAIYHIANCVVSQNRVQSVEKRSIAASWNRCTCFWKLSKWQQFENLCFLFPTIALAKAVIGLFWDVTCLRGILNFKALDGVISGETHASYTHGRGILLSFWNHWIVKPFSMGIYLENERKYLSLWAL